MQRSEALAIVRSYVQNENLIRHMLAVEAAMQDYALRLDQNPEIWGCSGLLHDFDWEIHPTLNHHPQDGAPILRQKGVPEEIIQAILSHADHTGVARQTHLQKALYACDEITGLITAVALVRPSKSIHEVKIKSIRKKWKDASFAAAVNREEIDHAAQDFGVPLWEHVENVLHSMQKIAEALDLQGTTPV